MIVHFYKAQDKHSSIGVGEDGAPTKHQKGGLQVGSVLLAVVPVVLSQGTLPDRAPLRRREDNLVRG